MKTNSLLELLDANLVVVPPIQRDYAQGRNTGKVPNIRKRFLDNLISALRDDEIGGEPFNLDFIYGYTEKSKSGDQREISYFKPLDGQQRLTTLFLLHWFIATKEGKIAEAKELLGRFSYATRHSSKLFCQQLINFQPVFPGETVDKQIKNQPWFFLSNPLPFGHGRYACGYRAKFHESRRPNPR